MKERYSVLNEFDDIMRLNLDGVTYWMLSDLAPLLGYNSRNTKALLYRAMVNCRINKDNVNEHFIKITRIEDSDNKPKTKNDYLLTRYACLLLVNNGDQYKDGIAIGKVYFSDEPNPREFTNAFARYDESSKRLMLRKEIKQWNQILADAVSKTGITTRNQYAMFQGAGYMGLYRMSAENIREKRAIPSREVILEYMGSTELIINLLRISQTAEKLKQEKAKTTEDAIYLHYEVGKEIRDFLYRIGGTMPEEYSPTVISATMLEKEHLAIMKHQGWPKDTSFDSYDTETAEKAESVEAS